MLREIYHVKEETIQEIGRFTINWNLFENYYLNNRASEYKIKNLRLEGFDFKDTMISFQSKLTGFFVEWNCREIDNESVSEILYHNENIPEWIEDITKYLKGENNDYNNGLVCIARIRNNMLHGEKDIYTINHQYELIKAANNVLEVMTKEKQDIRRRWSRRRY